MIHEVLDLNRLSIPPVLEALAFWGAIFLPFVYFPLLFLGLGTLLEQGLFLGLISLNALLIVLGHRHHLE